MDSNPGILKPSIDVCFLDSGVGGLAYLDHFLSRNPKLTTAYIADTKYFPYGPKSPEELRNILYYLMIQVFTTFRCSYVVLACNTASIVGLDYLRLMFPDKIFVGTVPAVKPAVLCSQTNSVGILGTTRTVKDRYIFHLANTYRPDCMIHVEPADDLVKMVEETSFVELNDVTAKGSRVYDQLSPYMMRFRDKQVDQVVLGCTHFLHLVNQFNYWYGNEFQFHDSRMGITKRIESLLEKEPQARIPNLQEDPPKEQKTYIIQTDPLTHSPLLQERLDLGKGEMYQLETGDTKGINQ